MEDLLMGGGTYKPYQIVLEFMVICLVPGFCEEFLFRGAILTNCRPFGRANAILISSLLFALMHQNPMQFFYTFVGGIVMGLLYDLSGSIWPGTLLHTLNNFASITQSVIAAKLPDTTQYAVAATLFEIAIVLSGIVCAVVLILRFFNRSKEFRNGVFGRSVPAADHYAAYPVSASRMRTLFFAPPMVVFIILCAMQAVLLLVLAVFYGLFV